VILRGSPPTNAVPLFQSPDYWVLKNPAAMPRAFVPQRVEFVPNDQLRLQKLAAPDFDPRQVAYVEAPMNLPATCQGTVELMAEVPTHLSLALRMETAGLVVLADRWDNGWHAYLNGTAVPILRANHAIRGVFVPAGSHRLEFRYWPASFALGLKLAGLALLIVVGWPAIWALLRLRKPGPLR